MKLTLFDNYHAGVSQLPQEEQDAFYGAIARYVFEGVEPELEGVAAAIWATIRVLVDKSIEGQMNGAKGGNGRGNKSVEKTEKPTAKTPSENPPVKPSGKTPQENPSKKPPAKTPSENQKKRKEKKGSERENPEGFSFTSYDSEDTATANAVSSPPNCPNCGSGMISTNSHKNGKSLFLCPECFEEVYT